MGFRENLKAELSYQGILVKELADKTGISKRTIDNYLREKSSTPPADIAVKIAQSLNVSVEYLVTGNDSKNSENLSQIQKQILKNLKNLNEKQQKSLNEFLSTL